ncbi:MAG: ABC transporter ATP-binding protein [Elusimicrobia bacterium]|nr:ABC transporter ATP-binding protein [Elusimicrobiota bacterium]
MKKNHNIIEMRNIIKRYPLTVANDNVNFYLRKNTIHCLVGENGAGKSTLMKILVGAVGADAGEIILNGEKCFFHSPLDSLTAGIGMVWQHFMLVDDFRVWENVVLGAEPGNSVFIDHSEATEKIAEISKRYSLAIDIDKKISDLSVGEAQRVEIIKLLYRNVDILILDEPTAVLTPQEVSRLYEMIFRLKKEGKSVIFITHKLREITEVADEVTVMRQGRLAGFLKKEDVTADKIAALMVGREVRQIKNTEKAATRETILETRGICFEEKGVKKLNEISFKISRGEIVGIAGVEGNGQKELVDVLMGIEKNHSGKILFEGEDITSLETSARIRMGISHIPQDRQKQGLIEEFSMADNSILGRLRHFGGRFSIDFGKRDRISDELISRFDIRPPKKELLAGNFSGGNQQKIVVGREIYFDPKFLIAAHPTRGVDIGAIEKIHSEILKIRKRGVGVLLISSELSEIFALSDYFFVIFEGSLSGPFYPSRISAEEVGLVMAGKRVNGEK